MKIKSVQIQLTQKQMYEEIKTMKFLTVLEVAKKLRISKETVYRYLQGGFIPGIKIGNKGWRIEASELKEFLEKHHRQKTKSKAVKYWTLKEPKKVQEPKRKQS